MITDHKENAPCGMLIHYSVDTDTDFVVYDDINGRGQWNKTEKCEHCSWQGICNPTSKDEEIQRAYQMGYVDGIKNGALQSLKIVQEISEEMGLGFDMEVGDYDK